MSPLVDAQGRVGGAQWVFMVFLCISRICAWKRPNWMTFQCPFKRRLIDDHASKSWGPMREASTVTLLSREHLTTLCRSRLSTYLPHCRDFCPSIFQKNPKSLAVFIQTRINNIILIVWKVPIRNRGAIIHLWPPTWLYKYTCRIHWILHGLTTD